MQLLRNPEIKSAGLMAAILTVFTLGVLSSGLVDLGDFAQLIRVYLESAFSLCLAIGLIGLLVMLVRNFPKDGGRSTSPIIMIINYLDERWQQDRLVSLLWPPAFFALMMASYNAYKQMILDDFGFHYDGLFTEIDRTLFLGNDPWRLAHDLLPGATTAGVIDLLYHGWYAPMALGVIICSWLSKDSFRLRNQYLFTYLVIWLGMGAGLATLFPAAGPVFVPRIIDPSSSFAELNALLASLNNEVEIRALGMQAGLLKLHGSTNLAIGGGISAMPSVHNALAILFALAAFKINRTFGWAMAVYALFIWISSFYLGWHYAIDGIVSLFLTLPAWHYCGKLADWLQKEPAPAIPTEAQQAPA